MNILLAIFGPPAEWIVRLVFGEPDNPNGRALSSCLEFFVAMILAAMAFCVAIAAIVFGLLK